MNDTTCIIYYRLSTTGRKFSTFLKNDHSVRNWIKKRDFHEKLSIRIWYLRGAIQLKSNNITKQTIFWTYSAVDEIFRLEIN